MRLVAFINCNVEWLCNQNITVGRLYLRLVFWRNELLRRENAHRTQYHFVEKSSSFLQIRQARHSRRKRWRRKNYDSLHFFPPARARKRSASMWARNFHRKMFLVLRSGFVHGWSCSKYLRRIRRWKMFPRTSSFRSWKIGIQSESLLSNAWNTPVENCIAPPLNST